MFVASVSVGLPSNAPARPEPELPKVTPVMLALYRSSVPADAAYTPVPIACKPVSCRVLVSLSGSIVPLFTMVPCPPIWPVPRTVWPAPMVSVVALPG